MTDHTPPTAGDALWFLAAIFLGLTLLGQMGELDRLAAENEALRDRLERIQARRQPEKSTRLVSAPRRASDLAPQLPEGTP